MFSLSSYKYIISDIYFRFANHKRTSDIGFPQINPKLIKKRIFKSPPFTEELVEAISLIAPQLPLDNDEPSRDYWEINQNASCWGEAGVLNKYLNNKWQPKKILEIGPGLGRSVIFISKKYKLHKSTFYLFDGEGQKLKYTLNGPRFKDSFCGNFNMLKQILKYNNVHNYRLIDAKNYNYNLTNVPGKCDLIYSFYAIGYHWSIDYFIKDILSKMKFDSIAFLMVPENWITSKIMSEYRYHLINIDPTYTRADKQKMLVLFGSQNL